jgi:hypothetical protein
MVSRAERLGHFVTDADPPFGSVIGVLPEDYVGHLPASVPISEHARGPAERAHGRVDRGAFDRLAGAKTPDLKQTAGPVPSALIGRRARACSACEA